MQHHLAICLLLTTFIASGASLSCEVCEGFGHTCEGPLQTCPPGFDTCGIVQLQSMSGLQTMTVAKTCLPALECDKDPLIRNLGRFGTTVVTRTCCKANHCPKDPPPSPPRNTRPNGKTCPASYCVHSLECTEEITQCAGDELYCFEINRTAIAGEMTVTTLMKGCSNAAVCNETSQSSGSFGEISVVASFQCTPASGTASSNPGFIRLFFQAWTGILVVRILS